jgi:hypothetical protein
LTRHRIRFWLTLSILGGVWLSASAAESAPPPVAADAFEQSRRLGRGVNIPLWNVNSRLGRNQPELGAEVLEVIRQTGFDHVRVNLHPLRGIKNDARREIDATWIKTLDRVVEQALVQTGRALERHPE